MDVWLIWLIIALVLLVVEMLTITAAVGMLGVAALITAGFAVLGMTRSGPTPRVHSHRHDRGAAHPPHRPPAHAPAPARAFRRRSINRGKPAYVVLQVSRLDGRVRIGGIRGEEWTARAYDQTLVIPAGATVDVLEISGTTALVYPRE